MISPKFFIDTLGSYGIDFFAGVPDSLLKNICAYIADNKDARHNVIAANEGAAVGLAAGYHLATGKIGVVYMQNSGEGNIINPLASLTDKEVYNIPALLLIGWRGRPGVHDEPQHVKQGKVTVSLFETIGIPTEILPDDEFAALEVVRQMVGKAKSESRPVALVVRKGLFAEYKLQDRKPDIAALPREQAIEGILKSLPEDAVVVSTTGMISREVYETRERLGQDHSRDFLTVGSMGHAVMIALGIAKAQPGRKVVCLDGDGASIMQMGNMAVAAQSGCANLTHIVLNNAAHDSVGGQPTVGGDIDLSAIAASCGYEVLPVAGNLHDLHVLHVLHGSNKPKFIEIKVAKGARKDLGRPKEPPQVNKALYMKTLGVRKP